ncbi:MAG TPA: 2-C-methyl-D-erythritol 4-phosphate cytidylyltransferase, partial [Sphingomicrobium sp.]|nr:2-C-methyl-D-erythritol 4-phosphate cytidylyltransferase [Sphingomicrobium sp.]
MTVTALIVAAGKGERLGGGLPKQYRMLGGKPVLRWAVEALIRHPAIRAVRVVIGKGQEHLANAALGGLDVGALITGGATRRQSVASGLMELQASHAPQAILIHDAARPFVPQVVVDRLLSQLEFYEGAIPGVPVADTLVEFDGQIGETVPREKLVRVQTPQAFVFEALIAAHQQWTATAEPTDDGQMVRDTGHEVTVVAGDAALNKLTTAEDFVLAEQWLASRLIPRTAMGFDVHAFSGEGPVMLGGIAVPHSRGLAGHSDADVVLHAITDALLGAGGLGDIGEHFPPSDPTWKGVSSDRFLRHAVDLLRARGAIVDHVDCTIIAEEPKVGPHRPAMRARIAEIAGLTADQVSIK